MKRATQWPDLDAMSDRELVAFIEAADGLARYADFKRQAARARINGNKKLALAFETRCHETYEKLPREAQWRRRSDSNRTSTLES